MYDNGYTKTIDYIVNQGDGNMVLNSCNNENFISLKAWMQMQLVYQHSHIHTYSQKRERIDNPRYNKKKNRNQGEEQNKMDKEWE